MQTFLRMLVLVSSLGIATEAALAEAPTGFEAGLRISYGAPFGKLDGTPNSDLKDFAKGQVPLWFDLGGRLSPHIFLGLYAQYGFALIGSEDSLGYACDVADCKLRDVRLGGQLHVHFLPAKTVDPWIGFGVGYEWLRLKATEESFLEDVKVISTLRGAELANVQAGIDYEGGDGAAIGLFASYSVGSFSALTMKCDPESACGDAESQAIKQKALHYWLLVGLRVAFVL